MAGDTNSCLKGQHTNFHLLSLTWCSGKGGSRVGWICLRETVNRSFEENVERVVQGAWWKQPSIQGDHSPPRGSSLKGNNSPIPKRGSTQALWCLSLIAECRETRLITKGDSHICKSLAKLGQSGLAMLEERLEMGALGRELRQWLLGSWC